MNWTAISMKDRVGEGYDHPGFPSVMMVNLLDKLELLYLDFSTEQQ